MANDEDTCAVCHADRPGPKNPIIFCDGRDCNIPVHKRCYGVGSVPKGDWFCQRCECKLKKKPTNVICCPMQTGAFKYTIIPGGFMHVVCAMWNKNIDHTSQLYAVNKRQLDVDECDICHKTKGLCIKCQRPGCSKQHHVTCAIKSHYIIPASSVSDKYVYYCPDHQPLPLNRRNSSTNNSRTANSSKESKRRRRRQANISSDEEDTSENDNDDDDDENNNTDDEDDENSVKDEDEEMDSDQNDDDDDDDDDDQDNMDDDSDDDMGLTPKKRMKSKSNQNQTSKRRATTTRKGPIKLFMEDQHSSDDDMGTTTSTSNTKNKLTNGTTNRLHQDSPYSFTSSSIATDGDKKKESSPTTSITSSSSSSGGSNVLSLTERLKAKRNKMEITSSKPVSPTIKSALPLTSSSSSPSLALDLNKPLSSISNSSSTISPTTVSTTTTASAASSTTTSSSTGSSSSASSFNPILSSSPVTSASSTSSSTPSSNPVNGIVKQKLPNKAHLSTTSMKSSLNGNGINNNGSNGLLRPGNSSLTSSSTGASTLSLTSSISSTATTAAASSSLSSSSSIPSLNPSGQQNKKLTGNTNINKSSNTTKVKDLDEIQNDIRSQRRSTSSSVMDMNNGNNNGLHRNALMDRKNSQQQQQQSGLDPVTLAMIRSTVLEAMETSMAGRTAPPPPPIPVPDFNVQQLQSKLQTAEREIGRMNYELRRADDFKRNVAEVFEGLNIQVPGSDRHIPPGRMLAHIEEYVNDIKSLISRNGPLDDKARDRVADFIEETIKEC